MKTSSKHITIKQRIASGINHVAGWLGVKTGHVYIAVLLLLIALLCLVLYQLDFGLAQLLFVFFTTLWFQLFLWWIGIESEWLGNVLDDEFGIRQKSPPDNHSDEA